MDKMSNWFATVFIIILCITGISYFFSDSFRGDSPNTGLTFGISVMLLVAVPAAIYFIVLSWRQLKGPRKN